jgi:hypothetical protein
MADIVHELRDRAYSSKIVDRLCERAADEIARLRLTDAEREAISDAADRYAALTPESAETVATLRGLLERLR